MLCNFKLASEKDKSGRESYGVWKRKRHYIKKKSSDSASVLMNLSEVGNKITQNVSRSRTIT